MVCLHTCNCPVWMPKTWAAEEHWKRQCPVSFNSERHSPGLCPVSRVHCCPPPPSLAKLYFPCLLRVAASDSRLSAWSFLQIAAEVKQISYRILRTWFNIALFKFGLRESLGIEVEQYDVKSGQCFGYKLFYICAKYCLPSTTMSIKPRTTNGPEEEGFSHKKRQIQCICITKWQEVVLMLLVPTMQCTRKYMQM